MRGDQMFGLGNRAKVEDVARKIDTWARGAYATNPHHDYFLNMRETIDYESRGTKDITHKLLLRDGNQIYKLECTFFVIFEPLEDFQGAFIRSIGPGKYNAYCHTFATGRLAEALVVEFFTTYKATQ